MLWIGSLGGLGVGDTIGFCQRSSPQVGVSAVRRLHVVELIGSCLVQQARVVVPAMRVHHNMQLLNPFWLGHVVVFNPWQVVLRLSVLLRVFELVFALELVVDYGGWSGLVNLLSVDLVVHHDHFEPHSPELQSVSNPNLIALYS